MKLYTHLTEEERISVDRALQKGLSLRAIARDLGRSASSISREIKRNAHWKWGYLGQDAQKRYKGRQKRKKSILFNDQGLQALVIEKLNLFWTPHEIAGFLKKEHPEHYVCAKTLYAFIYSPLGRRLKLYKLLKRKHKKRIPKGSRKKRQSSIPNLIPLSERPESANNRSEIGHLEGDLIINPGGNVAVLVERTLRYTWAIKNPSKHTDIVMKGIKTKLDPLPEAMKKSIAYDRGTEFAHHEILTQDTEMVTYFCRPHSPWEKGAVENTNGRLRRHIPKKSDISNLSQEELDRIIDIMNNTPRKCLGYKTPQQALDAYLEGVALQN
jgi:IS30 family transposase